MMKSPTASIQSVKISLSAELNGTLETIVNLGLSHPAFIVCDKKRAALILTCLDAAFLYKNVFPVHRLIISHKATTQYNYQQ